MSRRSCKSSSSPVFQYVETICGWRSIDDADIIEEPELLIAHEEDQNIPIRDFEAESSDLKKATLAPLEDDFVQKRSNEMRLQILEQNANRNRERSLSESFLEINLRPSSSLSSEPIEEINTAEGKQAEEFAVVKNVYQEHPDTAAMAPADADEWRIMNNHISVDGFFEDASSPFRIPNPITTFDRGFYGHPEIIRDLHKQGFEAPKPIQSQAWPILLSGYDSICVAQLGTGKTLTFVLPALIHVYSQPAPPLKRRGPIVLILTPDLLLAEEIKLQFKKFDYHGIKAVCLETDVNCEKRAARFPKWAQIVIATPAQFSNLLKFSPNSVNVKSFSFVVLDEADRMVEMGLDQDIRRSLADIRKDRHTVMTLLNQPSKVGWLVSDYMTNPLRIMTNELDLTAIQSISQKFLFLEEDEKIDAFMTFLRELKPNQKIIIFCNKEAIAYWMATDTVLMLFYIHRIYIALDSSNRQLIQQEIKNDKVNILLATHSMSRGLVIDNLTYIINFNMPEDMDEYVHCIGRTGLTAATGKVISYITPQDCNKATELVQILENIDQPAPEELIYLSFRYEKMKANGEVKPKKERRQWIY